MDETPDKFKTHSLEWHIPLVAGKIVDVLQRLAATSISALVAFLFLHCSKEPQLDLLHIL